MKNNTTAKQIILKHNITIMYLKWESLFQKQQNPNNI